MTEDSPKVMVAVLADEGMVEEIRNTIIEVCSRGQIGDGIVWAVPFASMHRKRYGADMLAE